MRADAQSHEIGAQAPLLGSAASPRDPLLDTGDPAASQGEGQTVIARRRINLRNKGLPYVQLGGAVRFVPQEIRDYLVSHRNLATHRLRQTVRKGGMK